MRRFLIFILLLTFPTVSWATTRNITSDTNTNAIPNYVDGDALAISNNATLTINDDTSGATLGFGAISIASGSKMVVSQTTGTYGAKLGGDVTGAGLWSFKGAGATDVLPTGVQLNLVYASGVECALTGVLNLRCAEPTIASCYTKAAYDIATKKIYVVDAASADARIDLDAEWKANYYIRIDNNSSAAVCSEEFQIESTGNDGGGSFVNLPALGAGLAQAKVIGAKVSLISRNIMLTGVNAGATYAFNGVRSSVLNVGIRNFNIGVVDCYSNTITTCSPSGCTNGLYGCYSNTITTCSPSGCATGLNTCYSNTITTCSPSGCTYGLNVCYSNTITTWSPSGCGYGFNVCYSNTITTCSPSGCVIGLYSCFSNTIATSSPSGCTYGLYGCYSNTITTCSPSGCINGLYYCCSNIIGGGAFGNNTYHFRQSADILATGLTFGTGTKWYECTPAYIGLLYNESANDGGVTGALSARTAGGTTARATGSGDFTHTCETVLAPAYRQIRYYVPPGATIRASVTGTMDHASMVAKIELLNAYDPRGTALDSKTWAGNTSEQTLTVTWTNGTVSTGIPNKYVLMRVSATYSSLRLVEQTTCGIDVGLAVGEVKDDETWIDWDGEKTGTYAPGGGVIIVED